MSRLDRLRTALAHYAAESSWAGEDEQGRDIYADASQPGWKHAHDALGESPTTQIPKHLIGPLERYIEHGTHPGGYLHAILVNDLRTAVQMGPAADLPAILDWLIANAPGGAWGSPYAVKWWIDSGHTEHIYRRRQP